MRFNIAERTLWIDKILPIIMEYGIYLLAIFLFTDKGESLRSLGIYIPPVALVIIVYLTRQLPFDWKNPLFLSIAALCISAILSAFISNESISFLHWFKRTYLNAFLIFIVITTTFKKTETLKRLLILLSLLSVFFIAMTFYDFITKALTGNGEILFNNIRNYNPILAYLLPVIPFALLAARGKFQKIFWILVLGIGVTALLLTGFRGGWISFLVSMAVWGVWLSFNRIRKTIILFLVGIVVTAFILLAILPSSHIAAKIQKGLSTTNRYEWIWKPYVQMYSEFPVINKIIGSGMTNETMYEYHKQYRQKLENFPDDDVPLNPHNHYLGILFKQGILGLILYINLIIMYLALIIKAIRKRNLFENKAMGIAILCPFVGEYIVHGLVEDLRFMPLGLLLGMAGAYLNLTEENKDKFAE